MRETYYRFALMLELGPIAAGFYECYPSLAALSN